MTDTEFNRLNPILMDTQDQYYSHKQAHLVQCEFFKTHTFIFDTLDERMAEVLKLRYGLIDGQCWTLQDISDKFNLSRERVRQIENKGIIKLRHPHRIMLMKKYTDTTFDKEKHQLIIGDFKSLIKQDIVNNISLDYMQSIQDINIVDLSIVTKGEAKQKSEDIKKILIDNQLITCKDLIDYLRQKGDLSELGIKDYSYRAIIYSICDLIDSRNAKSNCQKIFKEYIFHKKENEKLVEEQRLQQVTEQKRLKIQQKEEHLKNVNTNPELVLIEDLGFRTQLCNALKELNFNTLADLMNYYINNNRSFRSVTIGEKSEKSIIARLKQLQIQLLPDIDIRQQILSKNISTFPVEYMELSVRSYNCLKRTHINTIEELINYYIDHDMSLKDIRNLGTKCENEILYKLAYFGIDFNQNIKF